MVINEPNWPWTSPPTPRQGTFYLILHHTDGPQYQPVEAIWQDGIDAGDIGIAYHYYINGDGSVYRGRPENMIGAHALGLNYCSIGIALAGNFQNQDIPTYMQLDSLVALVKDIYTRYGNLPIIGHRDVAGLTGRPDVATLCPGDTFYYQNLPQIITEVQM
jgi:N-acetylmuramoyl-L-alanine amidase